MNSTICILGAAGFVGARTLRRLGAARCEIRVLAHRRDIAVFDDVATVRGAADDAAALDRALSPGATVLNFVYGGASEAPRIAQALGAACARRKVRRLVHVSTTDVYGAAPGQVIDERSPCEPVTEYQLAKHACEEILVAAARSAYELVILRPTAVFGPGGRNLESLALRVLCESWPRRYPRACAMGRRRMHAVDVDCVAAAALFLAAAPLEERCERFIVAQDEEPDNNYAALEAFFVRRFGAARYPVPPLSPPPSALRWALRAAGRSNVEPLRVHSAARLVQRGFSPPRPFATALEEYADSVLSHARP